MATTRLGVWLLLLGWLQGCGGGEKSECSPDTFVRHCQSDTVIVDCDPLGDLETQDCTGDTVCVEATLGDRETVLCIPEDSEACDPDTWEAECVDDDAWLDCSLSHTELRECDQGEVCLDLPDGPACVNDEAESCDPDEYEPRCQGDARIRCNGAGYTSIDEDCAEDGLICTMHEGEPLCVDEDAAPCDPDDFMFPRCEDGHVRQCGNSLLTEIVEKCASDEVCLADNCYSEDLPSCDLTSVATVCNDDATQVLRCDTVLGIRLPENCGDDETCVELDTGGECRSSDTEPCDASTYQTYCIDSSTRMVCSHGYTAEEGCFVDDVCKTSDLGGFCVPEDAEECDPTAYEATCTGDLADSCARFSHFTRQQDCAGDVMCVADQDFEGVAVAVCMLDNAPSCSDALTDSYCLVNTTVHCIGGYEEREDCNVTATDCVEIDNRAACATPSP